MVVPRQGWRAEGSHTASGVPLSCKLWCLMSHPTSPEPELHKILISTTRTISTGAPAPFSHFPTSGPDETMEHRDATQMAQKPFQTPNCCGFSPQRHKLALIELGVDGCRQLHHPNSLKFHKNRPEHSPKPVIYYYLHSNRTQQFHKMVITIFLIFT